MRKRVISVLMLLCLLLTQFNISYAEEVVSEQVVEIESDELVNGEGTEEIIDENIVDSATQVKDESTEETINKQIVSDSVESVNTESTGEVITEYQKYPVSDSGNTKGISDSKDTTSIADTVVGTQTAITKSLRAYDDFQYESNDGTLGIKALVQDKGLWEDRSISYTYGKDTYPDSEYFRITIQNKTNTEMTNVKYNVGGQIPGWNFWQVGVSSGVTLTDDVISSIPAMSEIYIEYKVNMMPLAQDCIAPCWETKFSVGEDDSYTWDKMVFCKYNSFNSDSNWSIGNVYTFEKYQSTDGVTWTKNPITVEVGDNVWFKLVTNLTEKCYVRNLIDVATNADILEPVDDKSKIIYNKKYNHVYAKGDYIEEVYKCKAKSVGTTVNKYRHEENLMQSEWDYTWSNSVTTEVIPKSALPTTITVDKQYRLNDKHNWTSDTKNMGSESKYEYKIVVTNTGTEDAVDVVVTDIPYKLVGTNETVTNIDAIEWTVDGNAVVPTYDTTKPEEGYKINVGNISAGASKEIIVKANPRNDFGYTLRNTVNAKGSNTNTEEDTVETVILESTELTIVKSMKFEHDDTSPTICNTNCNAVITIENIGNVTASNVKLNDILNPSDMRAGDFGSSIVLRSPVTITKTGEGKRTEKITEFKFKTDGDDTQFDLSLGDLQPGGTIKLEYKLYNEGMYGKICNTAIVSSDNSDDKETRACGTFVEFADLDDCQFVKEQCTSEDGNYTTKPIKVNVGDYIYYKITCVLGDTFIAETYIQDVFPDGLEDIEYKDKATGNWVAVPDDQLNGGRPLSCIKNMYLRPNEKTECLLRGKVVKAGKGTNKAEMTLPNGDKKVSTVDYEAVVEPVLNIEKLQSIDGKDYTHDNVRIEKGETINYKVRIWNSGNGVATNVVLEDVMPDGLTNIKILTPEFSTSTYDNIQIGTLDVNDEKVIEFSAVVNKVGSGTNRATVSCDEVDDETDEVTYLVPGSPLLHIQKLQRINGGIWTADELTVEKNDELDYKLIVTNNGDVDLHNVVVQDILPTGYIVNGKTDLTISELKVGDAEEIVITGVAGIVNGELRNKASVTADEKEDPTDSNEVVVTVETEEPIEGIRGIAIEKLQSLNGATWTKDELVAEHKDVLSYKLIVSNIGAVPLTNVVVTDILPDGFIPDKDFDGRIGILAVGDTKELIVNGEVGIRSGTLKNKASVSSDGIDKVDSNEVVVIVKSKSIAIEKFQSLNGGAYTKADLVGKENDTLSYKIVVTNNGDTKLTNVKVSDTLPDGFIMDGDWDGTIGDLGVGQSKEIIITGKIGINEGELKNKATVTPAGLEPTDSNEVKLTVTPNEEPVKNRSLSIRKYQSYDGENFTQDTLKLKENDKLYYKIVVENNGDLDLTGVEVTDSLPEGFVLDGDWDGIIGDLKVGQSKEIIISGHVGVSEGTLKNVAIVKADSLKPIDSNEVIVEVVKEPSSPTNPDKIQGSVSTGDGVGSIMEIGGTKKSPKTGDTQSILLWLVLLTLSSYTLKRKLNFKTM